MFRAVGPVEGIEQLVQVEEKRKKKESNYLFGLRHVTTNKQSDQIGECD